MKRKKTGPVQLAVLTVFMALTAAGSPPSAAQNPFEALGSGQRVYVSLRWDPAPLVAVGFGSGFHLNAVDRAASVDLEIRNPVFLGGWRDFQIRAGSRVDLVSGSHTGLVNGLDLIIHRQENARMRGLGISIRERVMAGRLGTHAFGAAEAGFTWFALNRIRFAATGVDLWIRGAGGKITLGGSGGLRTSGGAGIALDAALVRTAGWRRFNPAGPPILAGLSFGHSDRE